MLVAHPYVMMVTLHHTRLGYQKMVPNRHRFLRWQAFSGASEGHLVSEILAIE
jgi:hypothetical protein